MKYRGICAPVLLILGTAYLNGEELKLPDLGPVVRSIYPAGGQRGQSAEIVIRGRYLGNTQQIRFSRPDIVAEISSSEFYQVKARVDIGAAVPPGLYDYRLTTGRGSYVGMFHIGSLPQAKDTEPNNELAKAQKVTLPSTIDGQVDNSDYDLYRFHAKAGETVVLDLLSTRLGGQLHAKLDILDERGKEIAFNEDFYPNGDPHIAFTPKSEGDYIAQVSDAFEGGSPFSVYRLSIGVVPSLYASLPLGATAGQSTEIELRGVNLDKVTEVVLGDSVARGEILSKAPDRLTLRLAVPPDKAGRSFLQVSSQSGPSPIPLPFLISRMEELRSTGTSTRQKPEPMRPGTAITGVLEGRRAAHFYSLDVKAGDKFVFQVDSTAFGYPLDPALAIYDDAGRQVAFQDDIVEPSAQQPPAFDPYLVQGFDRDGRYVVKIRDTAERGDPRFLYRFTVRRAEPDFEIVAPPSQTLYRDRQNNLRVRIRRLDGWATPVEVWIDNLPPGISADNRVAEAKNTVYKNCCAEDQIVDGTDVEVQPKVSGDVFPGAFPLRIRARGTVNGKVTEHTINVLYHSDTGLGPSSLGEVMASVTDLPPIVLQTPQNFGVVAGKTAKLVINAQRFDDAKAPLKIEINPPAPGVTLENNELAPGSSRVEVQFRAAADAKPGTYQVVLRAGASSSPPMDFRVTAPPPEEKKP